MGVQKLGEAAETASAEGEEDGVDIRACFITPCASWRWIILEIWCRLVWWRLVKREKETN
jgi:hypothetical protein